MSDERVSRERFAEIASDTLDRVQEATPWPPIDPPGKFQWLWDDAMDTSTRPKRNYRQLWIHWRRMGMSEFRKGQLVAVRDSADSAWHLRVYDHASPEGLHFCRALNRLVAPCWWNQACSAEVVWPDIFLARDKVTIEHLEGVRQRLHERTEEIEMALIVANAQIHWLCNVLKNDARTEENNPLCPLNVPWDCEHTPCDVCWEQASRKAVGGDANDQA